MTTTVSATWTADGVRGENDREGLRCRSFVALLAAQFLSSANDNMFRWLLLPLAKFLAGPEHESTAVALGLAFSVLPFLLFAAPAGYLADRFSKRNVIVGCRFSEILIVGCGVGAIVWGQLWLLYVLLAVMSTQAALSGPSKYGSIPEMVSSDRISAANGLMGLVTVSGIVLGVVAGNVLSQMTTLPDDASLAPGQYRWWISAAALLAVGVSGWSASLLMKSRPGADPSRKFPFNAPRQTYRDLKLLASSGPLLRAALGVAFFWSLGSLAQANLDLFGSAEIAGKKPRAYIGIMLGVMVFGTGLGSFLAGIWSGRRIELGLLPLGAAAISAGSLAMFILPTPVGNPLHAAYWWPLICLLGLGIGGGLFNVPLQAFLQRCSPYRVRGSIWAANNFLSCAAMLAASGVFWILASMRNLDARTIFVLCGVASAGVLLYTLRLVPRPTARVLLWLGGRTAYWMCWLATRTVYRVRHEGMENLPDSGGVLLVANHVSFVDAVLIQLLTRRRLRQVAFSSYVDNVWLRWVCREMGVIPISDGRKAMVGAIREARRALRHGDIVGIFPEGNISPTGQIEPFLSGFLSMLKGTDAPVVPVHIDGLWGSVFSFERGRYFWKWPRGWRRRVTLRIGLPIDNPGDAEQVRQTVIELGSKP